MVVCDTRPKIKGDKQWTVLPVISLTRWHISSSYIFLCLAFFGLLPEHNRSWTCWHGVILTLDAWGKVLGYVTVMLLSFTISSM